MSTELQKQLEKERRKARRERLESKFALQMKVLAQERDIEEPVREHGFHPTRLWRFDFAWPERKVAVEVEGGIWTRGRHTRGAGFIGDCEKYNEAARLGWRVFRMPGPWVEGGRAARYMEKVLCVSD